MVLPSYYFGFEDDEPVNQRDVNWSSIGWNGVGWKDQEKSNDDDPCLIYCPDPVNPGRLMVVGSVFGVDRSMGRLHPCPYCTVPFLYKMNYCLQCGAPRYDEEAS